MKTKKVIVNLLDEQVAFLQNLAARKDMTFTDALVRAIDLEKFLVTQENLGRKVLVAHGRQVWETVRA